MRIGQWDHVVNIEITSHSNDSAGEGRAPLAGGDRAIPGIGECDRGDGFVYEHLVAGVLTIAVRVHPVTPVTTVIAGEVFGDWCNH